MKSRVLKPHVEREILVVILGKLVVEDSLGLRADWHKNRRMIVERRILFVIEGKKYKMQRCYEKAGGTATSCKGHKIEWSQEGITNHITRKCTEFAKRSRMYLSTKESRP